MITRGVVRFLVIICFVMPTAQAAERVDAEPEKKWADHLESISRDDAKKLQVYFGEVGIVMGASYYDEANGGRLCVLEGVFKHRETEELLVKCRYPHGRMEKSLYCLIPLKEWGQRLKPVDGGQGKLRFQRHHSASEK